jgi:Ca2+-binding RTX toxin-like protein
MVVSSIVFLCCFLSALATSAPVAPLAPVNWVVVTGGPGNDLLRGTPGPDRISGGPGNDTLRGLAGADVLTGGRGDDVIDGGDGDDWISGDRGADTLTGGKGADAFHLSADAGLDVVTDFNPAEDGVEVDPGVAFRIRQLGADTVIEVAGGRMVLKGVKAAAIPPGRIGPG